MLLVALFVIGYVAIVLELPLGVNKTASALLTGVLCWTVVGPSHLGPHLGELSGILFFLLGAMTIVELIDAHDGFELITARITTRSRRKLLVTIAILSFILSAVLDNLTTAIVMMSLVRKLAESDEDRMSFAGIVVIAANAGGAFSPIGDVTTTMLWIGGQITTTAILSHVVLPAVASVLVPLAWMLARMRGEVTRPAPVSRADDAAVACTPARRRLVLALGIGVLLFVPVFKTLTHQPPFMGVLLGLGVLWIVTERGAVTVAGALQRIDTPSILFFLGILLAISALETAGVLGALAHHLDAAIGNVDAITMSIGLSSAVVDNVPLVAAAQGMYSLATFPTDHSFWLFLAYCAGTGGSILIIGSAAGIAVMGIQRISFGWYVRKISLPALLGYLAGAAVFLAQAYFEA